MQKKKQVIHMEETSPPIPRYLQPFEEGKLTPQYRDLLTSLPAEPSWTSGSFHQYQGYWLLPLHLQALFKYRDGFRAHDSDVFLITLPKSGTTWVKAILFALVNRTRYDPTSPDHPLLSKNPHDLHIFLEYSINQSSEEKIPDFSTLIPPRIFCTHMPLTLLPESVKESNCKVIYVCRNPKDVFVSLWNFVNKLRGSWRAHFTLDEAFDKFCSGVSLGGPYWDNVLGHWKESLANPGKVMFLKYEDLKKCPGVIVRKVAEFIGCPFSPDEEFNGVVEHIISLCSLEKLSSLEVNGSNERVSTLDMMSSSFFRKGKVGDWTNYLTPEMVARIDRITEEKFQGSGLTF